MSAETCELYGSYGVTCATVRLIPGSVRRYCATCQAQLRRRVEAARAPAPLKAIDKREVMARELSIPHRCSIIREQAKILERIGHSLTAQTVDLIEVVTAAALRDVADAIEQLARDVARITAQECDQ
jgi:hypothetical protein